MGDPRKGALTRLVPARWAGDPPIGTLVEADPGIVQQPADAERAMQVVGEVLSVVRGSTISELEIEWEGGSVRVEREPRKAAAQPADAEPELTVDDDRVVVKSEHVGIVLPLRGAELPVQGQPVAEGARLAEIETLGIRNAVVAPNQGFVAEVLFEEGVAVEYGQPLFVLSTSVPSSASE
jgi:acetyl-CoA carboxylase biotin carboxyl carrier protein